MNCGDLILNLFFCVAELVRKFELKYQHSEQRILVYSIQYQPTTYEYADLRPIIIKLSVDSHFGVRIVLDDITYIMCITVAAGAIE